MPEISTFFGIKITMYWNDHLPPHFHAIYGDYEALVDIQNAVVIRGRLPSSKLKLVLAWTVIHQDELMQNWERASKGLPLEKIEPLR